MESNNFRSTGLQFTARYTLSSAKDNLSSTFSDANGNYNLGLLDPFDPSLDYGYADFDARHRFTSSFTYEVPYFDRLDSKLARHLLGGITVTGIFNARTGNPFTVWDCSTGVAGTCHRFIPGGTLSFSGSGNPSATPGVANSFDYINLPASVQFNNPVAGNGAVGPFPAEMTRRNAFRGPGYWNMDAGLYKRIKFNEKYSMQLRFEAFNIFNHSNLFIVNATSTPAARTPSPRSAGSSRAATLSGATCSSRPSSSSDFRALRKVTGKGSPRGWLPSFLSSGRTGRRRGGKRWAAAFSSVSGRRCC